MTSPDARLTNLAGRGGLDRQLGREDAVEQTMNHVAERALSLPKSYWAPGAGASGDRGQQGTGR